MFVTDVLNSRNLEYVVLQELRNHGIKYRLKKSNGKVNQNNNVIFGASLNAVPLQTVMCCGSKLQVPAVIYQACNMLKSHVNVEGLFRKAGSQTRQKDIKKAIDSGESIDKTCHAVDIASILKLYLRALPEPIIGNNIQELFLRCMLLSDSLQLKAVQNALLLLPISHLYILHYIMEFFKFVSSKSDTNKMDANNLAIVIAPSIMPPPSSHPPQRMEQHVKLMKLFIENANIIGQVPDCLILNIDDDHEKEEEQQIKKKRRSGSLTRMLSGLRKMVSGSSHSNKIATPDPLATPISNKAVNKRKQDIQENQLYKKRKEILNGLPQQSPACTPFRPLPEKEHKKLRLSIGRKSKEKKIDSDEPVQSNLPKIRFRSFSYSKNHDKKINFNKEVDFPSALIHKDLSDAKESDYVRISKSEYEAIKNRVSAIENRISQEFTVMTDIDHTTVKEPVKQVQSAYEKTLEEAAMLASPGTEQLAKRLSRELKIRQSSENKIIRSPSARKIGTIRRRSRENVTKLTRTQTWTVSSQTSLQPLCANNKSSQFYPNVNLKRGRPNTINTGLSQPSPVLVHTSSNTELSGVNHNREQSTKTTQYSPFVGNGIFNQNHCKRASSFHGQVTQEKQPSLVEIQVVDKSVDNSKWKNASSFLSGEESSNNPLTGRASVAKLRSQNAGMVLAKARLFDGMTDSDSSIEKKIDTRPGRHTTGFARKPRKYVSPEKQKRLASNSSVDTDSSVSFIETNRKKNTYSPGYVSKRSRNKVVRSPLMVVKSKDKLNLSSQLKEVIYDVCTPLSEKITVPVSQTIDTPLQKGNEVGRNSRIYKGARKTPPIKKPLSVKSNRTLKMTQSLSSDVRKPSTPMKAIHFTPRRQSPRLNNTKSRQLI